MHRDIQDWAEHYRVPLHFPELSCSAQYCAGGVPVRGQGKLEDFTGEEFFAYSAYWTEAVRLRGQTKLQRTNPLRNSPDRSSRLHALRKYSAGWEDQGGDPLVTP